MFGYMNKSVYVRILRSDFENVRNTHHIDFTGVYLKVNGKPEMQQKKLKTDVNRINNLRKLLFIECYIHFSRR